MKTFTSVFNYECKDQEWRGELPFVSAGVFSPNTPVSFAKISKDRNV